ncbi:MAG: rod shape-determining protein RodA [Pseudomonadota bacterium]
MRGLETHDNHGVDNSLLKVVRLDATLLGVILALAALGMIVLYSAGGAEFDLLQRQGIRLLIGLAALFVLAHIPADALRLWSPWIYSVGLFLLIAVVVSGVAGGGAQRWLDIFGIMRFQPSEIMKLAAPMMLAWHFSDKHLPPSARQLLIATAALGAPVVLIAIQPDLGTALLVASAGIFVIFLAGIQWRMIIGLIITGLACTPLLWHFMHDYQRQRVITLMNPEIDPLGSGYHIIQSKIAIGSGGLYGKGWLNGTQSQLDFLPERSTDFIFAVFGEEFGFFGVLILILIYLFIVLRGLYIATRAQDTYSRLLAGSLSLSFFVYFFVNMGMVTGMLPVVGVPLPLISYGGTSMVTLMAAFGILMSIHSHRRLLTR